MSKKVKQVQNTQENRFVVAFMDNTTQVQIAAATNDLDKFSKTDLMKMVKAFKEGVKTEEESLRKWEKQNESNKRGGSQVSKRVRRSPKIHKS